MISRTVPHFTRVVRSRVLAYICFLLVLSLSLSLFPAALARAETAHIAQETGQKAALRKGADGTSAIRIQAPPGAAVEVISRAGPYTKVRYRGVDGWVRSDLLILPALQYVMVVRDGVTGYVKGAYPERPEVALAFGAVGNSRQHHGAALELSYRDTTGERIVVAPAASFRGCHANERSVMDIQYCLNRITGFDVGKVDGVMGPKTRREIARFFEGVGLDADTFSSACQRELICVAAGTRTPPEGETEAFRAVLEDALAPAALVAQWREAERAFANRDCDALEGLPPTVLRDLSANACRAARHAENEAARAASLFRARDCDALEQIAETFREGVSVRECRALHARETAEREFETALEVFDCARAGELADLLGGQKGRVADCRETVQRRQYEQALAAAVVAKDCESIRMLETRLDKSGGFERCRFDMAMNAATAAEMLSAAERFEAEDDQDRAETIYRELQKRFPDDDLASLAVKRIAKREAEERRAASEDLFRRLGRQGVNTTSKSVMSGSRDARVKKGLTYLGYFDHGQGGTAREKLREALRLFQNEFGFSRSSRASDAQLRLMSALIDRLDLRRSVHDLPKAPYRGSVGTRHDTLIQSCRMSRKATFGTDREDSSECGYVNAAGDWVIPPVFATAEPFEGDLAVVKSYDEPLKRDWLIDRSGVLLDPAGMRWIERSRHGNGFRACPEKNRCGFLRPDGTKWLFEPRFTDIRDIAKDVFLIREGEDVRLEDRSKGLVLTGPHVKMHTVATLGLFLTSDRDDGDAITVFSGKDDVKKLTMRGTPVQVCRDRLTINGADGKKSWVYMQEDKSWLTIPGTFKTGSWSTRPCGKALAVQLASGRDGLLDLAEGKVVGGFDRLYVSYPDLNLFRAGRETGKDERLFGLVDSAGEWVVPPTYEWLTIGPEGHVGAQEFGFSVVAFTVTPKPEGGFSVGPKRRYSGDEISPVRGHPGWFEVRYGSAYNHSGGAYLVSPDGKIAPQTADRELALFMDACEALIGNNHGDHARLRLVCRGYLNMRATVSEMNPHADPDAMFSYAYALAARGEPVSDIVSWIHRAAEAGSVKAQAELGYMYAEGEPDLNIRKSDASAAKWLMRAAANGHDIAQFNLSLMYFNGRHFAQDYEIAYYWARQAAAQGNPDGIHNAAVLRDYFAALSAQKRQRARSLTLGDVFRGFQKYMPSQAELDRQRQAADAKRQCRSAQRSCYASCEGKSTEPATKIIGLLGAGASQKQVCQRDCASLC